MPSVPEIAYEPMSARPSSLAHSNRSPRVNVVSSVRPVGGPPEALAGRNGVAMSGRLLSCGIATGLQDL